ncbi:unnamed protein product [Orchesella dallaii]|uniref:Uncharacterized protein n=1 Tax=Orchesella dallaii TaxID=48710 RepID=A0ABP1Q7S1_9HEXA
MLYTMGRVMKEGNSLYLDDVGGMLDVVVQDGDDDDSEAKREARDPDKTMERTIVKVIRYHPHFASTGPVLVLTTTLPLLLTSVFHPPKSFSS